MGGGPSKQPETPVQNQQQPARQQNQQAPRGKGEAQTLQSRKQEQMNEVAQAKAARDALIQAEQEAAARKEEASK